MRFPVIGLLVLIVAGLPMAAHGQTDPWPTKPIRAIVPFAPGAAADTAGRAVLENLAKQLGQPIIIENRPGAGGTTGSDAAAHARPDGYTILVHSNSHTVAGSVYSDLKYDPAQDLTGVTPLVAMAQVFVTSSAKGIRNLRALVDVAKANPGSINYASAGSGSATHLGAERLRIAGGFTATHIPLKATSEALTEVLAGRVDYFLSPIGLVSSSLKSGRLVALAIASKKRSGALPDVPTTSEAGLENAEYDGWIGMFVPAKTPRYIINRLNEETAIALRSPDVQARLDALVMTPMSMPPDEFRTLLKSEFDMNAALVKAAGLRPN
jgi:tripartite-type tricarboxylate transporter receptor subunit TctC